MTDKQTPKPPPAPAPPPQRPFEAPPLEYDKRGGPAAPSRPKRDG